MAACLWGGLFVFGDDRFPKTQAKFQDEKRVSGSCQAQNLELAPLFIPLVGPILRV